MSFNSILEPTLQEILQVIKPVREDWESRSRIINELCSVVQSLESLRGATVEPFGSFVSNLFTRWGDLDISIQQYSGSSILYAGKKQKINLLGELLRALRGKGGWYRLQFIPNARVPILKGVSNIQRISCDISIDNLEGQLKSKFLFWISEIDGRFRDMVLLVKQWAKAQNINDPKVGTFNSYSLSLLIIFHFQTCVPAILPPLMDIYPRNAVHDLEGVRASAEENIAKLCAANIARYKSNKTRAMNRSSLSELFVSFLAKFSDINLKAQEMGVCPFTGRWESINSNMRWLPKTYSLFVEDPFEQPQNAARSVGKKQLEKIAQVFEMSWRCLVSGHNHRSLIATLTTPQVSKFLIRTPFMTPTFNNAGGQMIGGSKGNIPHVQPWVQNGRQPVGHTPKKQNQFQNGEPRRRNTIQSGKSAVETMNSLAGRQNVPRYAMPAGRGNGPRKQSQFQNGEPQTRNAIQNGKSAVNTVNSLAGRQNAPRNAMPEGRGNGQNCQRLPVQVNQTPGGQQRRWKPKPEKQSSS